MVRVMVIQFELSFYILIKGQCKENGDVYNSDKIVNNVEILEQLSADFVLTHIIFRALIYWAHRAVIFAIAQFSCVINDKMQQLF